MKNKYYIRLLSFVLTFILVFNFLSPLSVLPASADITDDSTTSDYVAAEPTVYKEAKDPEQLQKELDDLTYEVEALREENVKHFCLPDGTYQAVVYGDAIHRQNADGEWEEIDNSLSEINGAISTENARVKFAKKITGNENIYTLHEGSYKITVGLDGATKKVEGVVTNHNAESEGMTKLQKLQTIENISSSIVYKDILNGIDLEYIIISNHIKENIIVNKPAETYSYTFTLALNGLTAELVNNEILLSDSETNEVIYRIPVPYMYDSADEYSYDVYYTLTDLQNGKYEFTITADESWINDSERVFPVVIDPTITDDNVVFDTYISSSSKDMNYGTSAELWISSSRTTYIQIDPPYSIPDGSTITNATLNLNYYYYESVTTGNVYLGAYKILYPWDEYTLTWNVANVNPNLSISSSRITTANLRAEDSNGINDPGLATLDITSLMQEWIDGADNYGIALKYSSGTNLSVIIKSWEADQTLAPYYSVTYYPRVDITTTNNLMGVGGTQQLTYTTYPAGLIVNWSSSNPSIATVSSSGVVSALKDGSTRINISYYDSDLGISYTDYIYIYVYDSTGIQNGSAYYIMNYSSKRLLSLEVASDQIYTNVFTRERSANSLSQWMTEQQADGNYQLISVYSSSGKCLDVTGENVDIYDDTGREYLKFTIDRVESGTYKGLYLIRYGNKYVSQDTNYNVYVSSSRTDASYWSFMQAESNKYATLFCHDYSYIDSDGEEIIYDTSYNYSYFKTVMENLGFYSGSHTNPHPSNAYTHLKTNDVFVFMGHGGPGIISFNLTDNNPTGCIAVNSNVAARYVTGPTVRYIESCTDNELSGGRCIFYLGCETGKNITINDKTYNLVNATFDKGAHFVFGTTESIEPYHVNLWMEYFLTAIQQNVTIYDAIEYADRTLGSFRVFYETEDGALASKIVTKFPSYYVGDSSQYLNIE